MCNIRSKYEDKIYQLQKLWKDNKHGEVAIIGHNAVGKSAIVWRLVLDEYREDLDSTIEDRYSHNIEINGYDPHPHIKAAVAV